MNTIANLMRKFQSLDIDEISREAVSETTEDLADQNRAQLHAGYNRDSQLIGDLKPYASDTYAFYKANKNPLPGLGNPDLEDTGAFYAGIQVTVNGDIVNEDSTDEKSPELQEKYKDIFGLGGEFKTDYVNDSLRPAFKAGIEEATGLKLT